MRLLVACPQCRRQFDASRVAVGTKFYCRCGELLTAIAPHGHDAAVVRCSSCGAPREERSASCGHCSSDYTLHERDLHTVCPQCLARVSDRAKYCHHCGLALAASQISGDETRFDCPQCAGHSPLSSRPMGDERLAVLECGRCAGLWVEAAVFEELVERARANTLRGDEVLSEMFARRGKSSNEPPPSDAPPEAAPGTPGAWRYRHCPVCGAMMQRRHYAKGSGVIIDVCRHDGVWFDADELHRILLWVRSGGLQRAQRRTAESDRAAERLQELRSLPPGSTWADDDDDRSRGSDLTSIANVMASLFKIF